MLSDGTISGLREKTSSGGPRIDVKYTDGSDQFVHLSKDGLANESHSGGGGSGPANTGSAAAVLLLSWTASNTYSGAEAWRRYARWGGTNSLATAPGYRSSFPAYPESD